MSRNNEQFNRRVGTKTPLLFLVEDWWFSVTCKNAAPPKPHSWHLLDSLFRPGFALRNERKHIGLAIELSTLNSCSIA
jgi:hypothetical protein